MARENSSGRGAMLALASLLVVFTLTIAAATPARAYYYDTDEDGLSDFHEAQHGMHGDVADETDDWDGDGLLDVEEDTNLNGIVDIGETDPANVDTDGDGISDFIEGLEDSPEDADDIINALDLDSDGDFIPDGVEDDGDGAWEAVYGETNWRVADTDGDGLIDGWEAMWGTDPLDANGDGDGWSDHEEVLYGTNPNDPDTDNDGLLDGAGTEDASDTDGDGAINAADADSDNDGATDHEEDLNGNGVVDAGESDPLVYDTDGDGLSDGYELHHAGTDPSVSEDSDGDGWYDGEEITIYKTDPENPDTDGDGRWDGHGNEGAEDPDDDGLISALDLDSDNDGMDDAVEDANADGVVDAGETDPTAGDTDGDGLGDNHEVMIYGTSPTDASDPGDADALDAVDEIYTYKTNFDMDDTDGDGLVEGMSGAGVDWVTNNFDGGFDRPFGDSSFNSLDVDTDGDGIWDGEEASLGTDAMNPDSDDDGLRDGEEVYVWGTDPADDDTDDDGLEDGEEIETHRTNPLSANTDGDFVDDGVEVNGWGSNPLDADTDGDGIADGETITGHYLDAGGASHEWIYVEDNSDIELGGDGLPNWADVDADWRDWEDPPTYVYLDFHDRTELLYENYTAALAREGGRFEVGPLNPGDPDTDMDGYPDAEEVACGFDPLDAADFGDCSYVPDDTDLDGLFDIEEEVLGTLNDVMDSDGDGLDDGDETHPSWWDTDGVAQEWGTDPRTADSDADGLDDLAEVTTGTNPHYEDTDGDGVTDGDDDAWYDALDPDVDGDGLHDGYEDVNLNGLWQPEHPYYETDPWDGDTDDDGIYDGDELTFGTEPLTVDSDGDGLGDGLEVGYNFGNIAGYTDGWVAGDGDDDPATKTDPRLTDSDFDGIDDGVEDVDLNGMQGPGETDAADRDTDEDGLPDYYEAMSNTPSEPYCAGWYDNSTTTTNPAQTDTDGDGLADNYEFAQVCDPSDTDTDGDTLTDGDEYVSYHTDPSNPDTDSDGCYEGDVEDPTNDNDGDGSFDTMDVDSDEDWVWDCDGEENYADDGDDDGIVNVWDGDSDNDNLSDIQEKGLDTWHTQADNDRDFDDDGIMDGDEYYHEVHQPHDGEPDFEASDPTRTDTDLDGLHDGFEVGVVGPIPVDVLIGGTDVDPGFWDADGDPNSHPMLYDTDADGLSDYDEDLDVDGSGGDVGYSEPDPRDGDTDDDGLIDGYELAMGGPRDPMTDCLLVDSDDDDLCDGLEWGLLEPMGADTDTTNPWPGHARYDVVDQGARTTDPTEEDTDDDALTDGAEDANWDGNRDGNSPYDADDSDWGGGGETDPNVCDTDRGGVSDGDELLEGTDPLLNTTGDWDIDIDDDDGEAVGGILHVGVENAGIVPNTSGESDMVVWHTDGTNPDEDDGPSMATAAIDSVYIVATSLHWAGEHSGESYTPTPDGEDWIPYTAIDISPRRIDSFAVGASQTVTVTVDVPEGALPGYYTGYVLVETERPNAGWPDDCVSEQELPDDHIELRVWVAPVKDIDICDDDGDPLGVGLASDPYDFWEPAAIGEMHLAGAPYYTGGIRGMFRVANPNTYPDEDADGTNDVNGLPALPHIWRDWDLNTFDTQGNVDLVHDVRAEFTWTSGPADPTAAISFDSPLSAGMALATIDSFYVNIDTSDLPVGDYEGVVRVFEDAPIPPDDPNGYWDEGEVYDTFVLKFMLVLPDIDIADDYANMSGNELSIQVEPGEVGVTIGDFQVFATGPSTNIDDWDGPGTEDILDLAYYDPSTDTLEKIPADGGDPVSVLAYAPDGLHSIEVLLDGVMGDTLTMDGPSKLYRVRLADIPADLPAGTYRTNHPETWVPGDGTIPVAARGVNTGIGAYEGEAGPGIVYEPTLPEVATLMDYFHLTIEVSSSIDVEFDQPTWIGEGEPGEQVCGIAVVNNIGNSEASDVHFEASNLIGPGVPIPASVIDFDPASLVVPLDANAATDICISIPVGQRAGLYEGTVALLAAGEEQFDELAIQLTVGCTPDMEVTATETPVELIGQVGAKRFDVCNLGNCELTDLAGEVTIDEGIMSFVTIPDPIGWDDCAEGTIDYGVESTFLAGTYMGTVEITAEGELLSDSFPITVIVPEYYELLFDGEVTDTDVVGEAGEDVLLDVMLVNIGNVAINSGISFVLGNLVGDETAAAIPGDDAEFPEGLAVPYLGDTLFHATVPVPDGLLGQRYTGTLQVLHDGVEMDRIDITIEIPREESQATVYPNPFKMGEHEGGVTVALPDLPPETVIMVYDMFGGLVAELEYNDGNAQWDLKNDDGKTVASGMYIVTIDTGEEVITRKIMVIK